MSVLTGTVNHTARERGRRCETAASVLLDDRAPNVRNTDLFALLERTADAAFTVDQEGVIRSWNVAAEQLFGVPAASAIGQPCEKVMQGTDALGARVCAADCDVRRCAVNEPAIRDFDITVRTPAGRRLWVNVSTLVSDDARTGRALVVHLARDVTAAKSREMLLRRAATFAHRLIDAAEPASGLPPVTALTPQETRILRLLAEGAPASDIARRLRISPRTLRTHIHHINRKLHARSRLEAVVHGIRRGLIPAPRPRPERKRRH